MPSREIKSSVDDEIRGEVGGVVGLEILLRESRLLLNSDEATVQLVKFSYRILSSFLTQRSDKTTNIFYFKLGK